MDMFEGDRIYTRGRKRQQKQRLEKELLLAPAQRPEPSQAAHFLPAPVLHQVEIREKIESAPRMRLHQLYSRRLDQQ